MMTQNLVNLNLTPPWVHDKSSFGELLNPEINEP